MPYVKPSVRRLQRQVAATNRAIKRNDEKIGELMSKRVDLEEHLAELLTELEKAS